MNSTYRKSSSGGALLCALFIVTVLAALAGFVITKVSKGRAAINQAGAWQESLTAAEAGVHQAIAQVNNQVLPYLNQQTSSTVLTGSSWSGSVSSGTVGMGHSGDSNANPQANYNITAYSYGVGLSGSTIQQPYFLITSSGTGTVSGGRSYVADARDVVLRKLTNMKSGSSGNASATRKLCVWLRPVSTMDLALLTKGAINMNNHNIVVDSFNSSDPLRSGTDKLPNFSIEGYYNLNNNNGPLASPVLGADVATDSQFAGIGNATIYGDVNTNGGTVGQTITGIANVLGVSNPNFYEPIASVLAPTSTFTYATRSKIIKSAIVLTAGSKASPARYLADSVTLAGGSDMITFDFGKTNNGSNDKSQSYVELYVIGDMDTRGGGSSTDGAISIVNGVNVKIYVGGNINTTGNGIVNKNNVASTLSIYGITPTDGTTRSMTLAGNSKFIGTVYAPAYDLTLGGNSTFVGSLVGNTATLIGNTRVIYDEALAGGASIARFAVASWFEDVQR
ncbi:MAG: hypothetical protein WCP06_01355 [Verrucomicrobiota bacterium]